uniref:Calcium/calmodulin-dependent protein kinase type IV-like n=1 Tax=Phallusia mammillata TaxID=59560 RepID=A0A6F9D921_9ASCI|nr:calcium/calmodulin-dependent protein kinase type IV-like [Phallusia mammillata]
MSKKSTAWFGYSRKGPVEELYEVKEEIGRGGSAIVYLLEQKGTGKLFAKKSVVKKVQKKLAQTEIGILLTLSHPNIIKLKDIYESDTQIHLILEYVNGGELFDRIVEKGFYSERDAANVIQQILEAVAYLHSKNIVHRDLKPENLLYSDDSENAVLKVADFGLSRINDKETMKTICGTPGYVAPEILLGKQYTESIDIWAVGVIAYILLCGFEPFYDERGDQAMFQKILKCDYEFISPYWDGVSANAKDLVKKLLVLDPKKRLTARQALQHPWVRGKATNFVHMDTTVDKLKKFNARRKVKAVFQMVSASTRMGARPSSGSNGSTADESA